MARDDSDAVPFVLYRDDFGGRFDVWHFHRADVVFSGGLIRNGDGTADFYAGTSDAEAQKLTIVDPFTKYERQG